MKKKIKIIDLFNKIANDEIKQGTKFRIFGIEYIYNNGYLAKNDANKTMDAFYISQRSLNDEIEILDSEDEFEDIEEYFAGEGCEYSPYNCEYKINQLIRNQKKIIERLKDGE